MLLIYAIMVFLFLVITGLPVRPFHSLPVFPSNLATLKDFEEEIPAKFLEYELPPRISSKTDEERVILHLIFFLNCFGGVWLVSSNFSFHILNNITHISTHFFTHTYIKNTQTTLLKLLYQTALCFYKFLFLFI